MNINEKYGDILTLETERLILRKITLEDAKDMYTYASNEEVTKYVTWDRHSSLSETIDFINKFLPQYDAPWGLNIKKMVDLLGQSTLFGGNQNTKVLMYVISNTLLNQMPFLFQCYENILLR